MYVTYVYLLFPMVHRKKKKNCYSQLLTEHRELYQFKANIV